MIYFRVEIVTDGRDWQDLLFANPLVLLIVSMNIYDHIIHPEIILYNKKNVEGGRNVLRHSFEL